jgi:hypothetical protein
VRNLARVARNLDPQEAIAQRPQARLLRKRFKGKAHGGSQLNSPRRGITRMTIR